VAFQPAHFGVLRDALLFMFTLLISHIVVVTAIGIYYLMDRLYRRDQRVLSKKKHDDAA
jgi:Tfp pilus assembly protein PilW